MTIKAAGIALNAGQLSEFRADGGVIDFAAGGQSVGTAGSATLVFSNSNGLSFGLNADGGSVLTASYTVPNVAAFLTTAALSNHSHGDPTLALTGLSGSTASASNGLTISLSASQSVQTQNSVLVQGSSGQITFSASNGVTFGGNARTITASVETSYAASNHSHGNPTLALTNLTGTTASASNGLTISLSAADPSAGGVAVSADGSSQNAGTIVFSNSNGVSFGMNGSTITATVQPGAAAGIAAIAGGTQTATSGTMVFADSNGITFGMSGSTQITASHNGLTTQTVQTQSNVRGIIVSDTTYRTGDVSFSNLNGASFGSNGANVVTMSYTVPSVAGFLTTAALSNHSHGDPTLALTNLSGTTASASNGLTLSLSAAATVAQTNQTVGLYATGNTTQNSSSTLDARSITFNGLGAATLGFSNGSVQVSVPVQTAQTQSNVQGIIVSDTTYRTGDVSFSNLNGITFGSNGANVVTASYTVPSVAGFLTTARASNDAIGLNTAQTNVTWTVNSSGLSFNAAGYAGTGTSKTGGAVMTLDSVGLQFNGASLAGTSSGFTGANISASITHNTAGLAMSMSVAAPSAATISGYAVSNTTQSTSGVFPGAMSFQGVGGVSVGISNGSVVIQGPDLSSISATGALSASSNGSTISLGVGTVTASIIGNTTQTSTGTINLNGLVISGAGGVSAGISAGSIIISGNTGGGAEVNAHNLLGANTAGNTTATGSTIGLSGVNLTLSGTNASQIVISAPATSSLVGASGLSVSTNGSTISVYRAAMMSRYLFEPPGASSAGSAMTQGSMSFQRVFIPDNITFTRVDVPVLISLASSGAANTGNLLISSGCVIYTVSNGSTLNPIVGAFGTTTYTHASNTANFNSVTGPRFFSFPLATVLPPGEYFVGVQLSTNNNSSIGTATTALGATISIQHGPIYTASQWQEFGAVTATSVNMRPFVGVAASVTATGATQQMSNITQTGTALMRANIPIGFRA